MTHQSSGYKFKSVVIRHNNNFNLSSNTIYIATALDYNFIETGHTDFKPKDCITMSLVALTVNNDLNFNSNIHCITKRQHINLH